MTTKELAALIGRVGVALWRTGSGELLRVPVQITDSRRAFGRVDVRVTPLLGGAVVGHTQTHAGRYGSAWLSEDSVELEEPAASPEDELEELRRRT